MNGLTSNSKAVTKQSFEHMKKNYIAPQTEAIQLLAENAIMMASPGGAGFIKVNGDATGGYGD